MLNNEPKFAGMRLDRTPGGEATVAPEQSLFEHFAWLYIFCREKLFRDDTNRIINALWPGGAPTLGQALIELGCGPGFYSCRLAKRFQEIKVLGVDRCPSQLNRARQKAKSLCLQNCGFEKGNALQLAHRDGSFDMVVASRLFTILPDGARAVAEMFRVLRPGGRCFIAEPRYASWASLPLGALWLLAAVTRRANIYLEPAKPRVLSSGQMHRLFATQPWKQMNIWQEGRYHYATCEKGITL